MATKNRATPSTTQNATNNQTASMVRPDLIAFCRMRICRRLPWWPAPALLGQPPSHLLVEQREVLHLGKWPIGGHDGAHPIDQDVDRPPGRGKSLELALDDHQGLSPDGEAMAFVDLGGNDQIDRPVLVLEQHEHDSAG